MRITTSAAGAAAGTGTWIPEYGVLVPGRCGFVGTGEGLDQYQYVL